ncbi:MAG TPA: hypothetical protein VMB47_09325 [Candidatus Aquilonibacter sp.]|nr:hypothetical protein [Candidatus Aquilonibacter sp.]
MTTETKYERKFAWRTVVYSIAAIILVVFLVVIAYGLIFHHSVSAQHQLTPAETHSSQQ